MNIYHEMYLKLAGATADAIEALQAMTKKLIRAQQEAEDILLRPDEEPDPQGTILTLLPQGDPAEQRD